MALFILLRSEFIMFSKAVIFFRTKNIQLVTALFFVCYRVVYPEHWVVV